MGLLRDYWINLRVFVFGFLIAAAAGAHGAFFDYVLSLKPFLAPLVIGRPALGFALVVIAWAQVLVGVCLICSVLLWCWFFLRWYWSSLRWWCSMTRANLADLSADLWDLMSTSGIHLAVPGDTTMGLPRRVIWDRYLAMRRAYLLHFVARGLLPILCAGVAYAALIEFVEFLAPFLAPLVIGRPALDFGLVVIWSPMLLVGPCLMFSLLLWVWFFLHWEWFFLRWWWSLRRANLAARSAGRWDDQLDG